MVEKKKPGLIFSIAAILVCIFASYVARINNYSLTFVMHYGKIFACILAIGGLFLAIKGKYEEASGWLVTSLLSIAAIILCLISFHEEWTVIQAVTNMFHTISGGVKYVS